MGQMLLKKEKKDFPIWDNWNEIFVYNKYIKQKMVKYLIYKTMIEEFISVCLKRLMK